MLGLVLLGVMLTNVWQQGRQANLVLTADEQAPDPQASAIQWAGRDFQSRWFGSPAMWQPPSIDNTDIQFFEVKGSTQTELIRSPTDADICKAYGPMPAGSR